MVEKLKGCIEIKNCFAINLTTFYNNWCISEAEKFKITNYCKLKVQPSSCCNNICLL